MGEEVGVCSECIIVNLNDAIQIPMQSVVQESNLLQTCLNGSVRLAGEGALASLGQETVGKVQSQPKYVKW